MIDGVSPDLPHTAHLAPSKEWPLRFARVPVAAVLRSYWRVRIHDAHRVPADGPVILAANHIGFLDGPLLVAVTRRLTFAMAKNELFAGLLGRALRHVGQIPLKRREHDAHAISTAIQVLRAHRVLAVFPEGVRTSGEVAWARGGAAYLAMVSGAPVVPVAIIGTRLPGQRKDQVPPARSTIHVVYGEPLHLPRRDWPRRKAEVAALTEVVRTHLAAHVAAAVALTGATLPGPPPPKIRTA